MCLHVGFTSPVQKNAIVIVLSYFSDIYIHLKNWLFSLRNKCMCRTWFSSPLSCFPSMQWVTSCRQDAAALEPSMIVNDDALNAIDSCMLSDDSSMITMRPVRTVSSFTRHRCCTKNGWRVLHLKNLHQRRNQQGSCSNELIVHSLQHCHQVHNHQVSLLQRLVTSIYVHATHCYNVIS